MLCGDAQEFCALQVTECMEILTSGIPSLQGSVWFWRHIRGWRWKVWDEGALHGMSVTLGAGGWGGRDGAPRLADFISAYSIWVPATHCHSGWSVQEACGV